MSGTYIECYIALAIFALLLLVTIAASVREWLKRER